ncbi:hypothetical protein PV08_02002 [Exophiala spinifera]|uniref:Ketoreductase (KR) domain-containing protein n=1 Tax=Exophiala spinifera TaxID=91928 RepID=A0A0D2A9I4_9EURO|nr:uncharacterized protein PV08_02002 [Exophiala spinifera]KIW21422.1 hypothetical protein PV08_02002 [Exophiala spinifera]
MVNYKTVQESNHRIATTFPPGLVAVFVGATNGIGMYTLRQFAQYARKPRVYFIGRSQEAGNRIANECQAVNPEGSFTFIQADTSLLANVDEICQRIQSTEKVINLLFLTQGTLDFKKETPERLPLTMALVHYARIRFIHNLLPQLQAAHSLKRVVSVLAATKEGEVDVEDIDARHVPLHKKQGHTATLATISMSVLAERAPDVSFVHDYPGFVKSGIGRDIPGVVGYAARGFFAMFAPLLATPAEESGAYHLFFATSARYSSKSASESTGGVSLASGVHVATSVDGVVGGGIYSIDENGESASIAVQKLLAKLKKEGVAEKIWTRTEEGWKRVLGEGGPST